MTHEDRIIILRNLNKHSGWKTRIEIIYGGICSDYELTELLDNGLISTQKAHNEVTYYNVSRKGQEELIKYSVDNLFKDFEL